MKIISLFVFVLLQFNVSFSQTTYLHCGAVLDCKGDAAAQEQTIIIEKNKIKEVVQGYEKAPNGVKVIDLKDQTVMPGFMDMHVHIESQLSPGRYAERFRISDPDVALRATMYCERTLMAGFTTVRDLGGQGRRDAFEHKGEGSDLFHFLRRRQ